MKTQVTKSELQGRLKKAGVMYRAKATKGELEKLLADSQKANGHATPKKDKLQKLIAGIDKMVPGEKANGHKKEATPKKSKRPLGAKALLRERFIQVSVVTSKDIEQIATSLKAQPATVRTALSDLKNAKYAGKAGPLNIEKDDDGTYRLVQ